MEIGNLKIKGKVILAPMCDVTNLPFRVICKRYGAAIVYTEMIHAEAYLMGSPESKKRALFLEEERPIGVQIVGNSVEKLKKAVVKIEKEIRPDIIDINIGCPAHNVVKGGSGSALLRNRKLLAEVISSLSASIKIPLTCKMRILENEKETLEAAMTIEKSGAKALTVHGRTAKQRYSGRANWEIVGKIKKALSIPVILNGDVIDEESAQCAFNETGCDAVMVGRATLKNPFILRRISYFIETGKKIQNSFRDRIKDFEEIAGMHERHGIKDITSLKTLAQSLTKGEKGGSILRKRIAEAASPDEIKEILDSGV